MRRESTVLYRSTGYVLFVIIIVMGWQIYDQTLQKLWGVQSRVHPPPPQQIAPILPPPPLFQSRVPFWWFLRRVGLYCTYFETQASLSYFFSPRKIVRRWERKMFKKNYKKWIESIDNNLTQFLTKNMWRRFLITESAELHPTNSSHWTKCIWITGVPHTLFFSFWTLIEASDITLRTDILCKAWLPEHLCRGSPESRGSRHRSLYHSPAWTMNIYGYHKSLYHSRHRSL